MGMSSAQMALRNSRLLAYANALGESVSVSASENARGKEYRVVYGW